MILNRTILLLALAPLFATMVGPALAQPEVDVPRGDVEKSHGDGSKTEELDARLPKSTSGLTCVVVRDGPAWASAKNETGTDIPAGAVVTFYVQPGNIQKPVKVQDTWPAGTARKVKLDGELPSNAECAVKIKSTEDSRQTFVPTRTVGIDKPAGPLTGPYGFTCEVTSGGIIITNTGTKTIKKNSHLAWDVGAYDASWYSWEDIPPGESFFVPNPSSNYKVRAGAACHAQAIEQPA